MQPEFSLPAEIFIGKHSRRILKTGPPFRSVLAHFKAHTTFPNKPMNPQAPGYYAGNLVLRGSGTYTDWNGRSYKLGPGSFFQRLPERIHQTWYDPKSNYAEFFIWLDPNTAGALLDLELLLPIAVMDVGVNQLICESAMRLLNEIAHPESELPGSSLLLHILHFIQDLYTRGRQRRRADFWTRIVMDACTTIANDIAGRQQLEQIAELQKVAYPTFRKNFKRIVGMSPGEYRIRARLNQACAMLMEKPVKQVAAELGYASPFTFSTQFRAFIGSSPQQFQMRAKSETGTGSHNRNLTKG